MTVKQLRDRLDELCALGHGYADVKWPNDEFAEYNDLRDGEIFVAKGDGGKYCVLGAEPRYAQVYRNYENDKVVWPKEAENDRKRAEGQAQQGA